MQSRSRSAAPSCEHSFTVGQALLRYLELEGVDRIFGIPGSAVGNLLVNLKDYCGRITYVIARHESGATYSADGYFRATGKLGVVLVTSGPGATNALTGAVNAEADGSALLTISGEVARQFFGKGYFQEGVDCELDIDRIYSAATSFSSVIDDASEFQSLLEEALRIALSIPRRAVHVSVPNDVAAQSLPSGFRLPQTPTSYRSCPTGAQPADAKAAVDLLLNGAKPLIFLGNGCRTALRNPETLDLLKRFAERHAIPVATTADAKGIFPETHCLSLRNYGFASCRWPQQWMAPQSGSHFDALLVVGSGLRSLSTENWNERMIPQGTHAALMQVDLSQQAIGRGFPITHGAVAEAGAFIRLTAEIGMDRPIDEQRKNRRAAEIAGIKQKVAPFLYPDQYDDSRSAPIQPAAFIRVLQSSMQDHLREGEEPLIFLNAGNCVAWGIHSFVIDPPWEIHSSLDVAPMGFASGAVVGAKMGRPDKMCVAVIGDGAFMMHGAEISTAQAHKAGAIWVVLQDNDLHMVTQGLESAYPDAKNPGVWEDKFLLGNPDLVAFAKGLGADAYLVDSCPSLAQIVPAVLDGARGNRPQVIVASINKAAFSPFFPPRVQPPTTGHGIP